MHIIITLPFLMVSFVSTQRLAYASKETKKNLFLTKVFASDLLYCVVQTRLLRGLAYFYSMPTRKPFPNACKMHAHNVAQCTSVHTHVRRDGELAGVQGCKGEWHGSIYRLPSGCQSLVTPVGSDKHRHKGEKSLKFKLQERVMK